MDHSLRNIFLLYHICKSLLSKMNLLNFPKSYSLSNSSLVARNIDNLYQIKLEISAFQNQHISGNMYLTNMALPSCSSKSVREKLIFIDCFKNVLSLSPLPSSPALSLFSPFLSPSLFL